MPPNQKPPADLLQGLLQARNIRALIFDLDGVVTQTATLHARAWKKLFDGYLENLRQKNRKSYEPFSIEKDYLLYIDGIPRLAGVQNFLQSRGIRLPLGNPTDGPEQETIFSLGNQKNQLFHDLIRQGVEVFPDTIHWIRQQRAKGFRTAIISASKNCRDILQAAGVENLFEARVDGVVAEARSLQGKPAPDVFLEAARCLKMPPAQTAVFEDARAGVQAGKEGGFGLVVGVNRRDEEETNFLLRCGADVVIRQFDDPTVSKTN